MRYKKTDKSIPEIGREFVVDEVIEGSFLRVGNQVRVTAQLVHSLPDEHRWVKNFDRDLGGILALYSDVA